MKPVPVSLGDIVVSSHRDDVLVCYGLGSCVAVCVYDAINHVGGMYHCVLPSANGERRDIRCADVGIPELVRRVCDAGALRFALKAKIVGGASVLHVQNPMFDIGNRNIHAVREKLKELSLDVAAEEVGDHISRTVRFHIHDGSLLITTKFRGERTI